MPSASFFTFNYVNVFIEPLGTILYCFAEIILVWESLIKFVTIDENEENAEDDEEEVKQTEHAIASHGDEPLEWGKFLHTKEKVQYYLHSTIFWDFKDQWKIL